MTLSALLQGAGARVNRGVAVEELSWSAVSVPYYILRDLLVDTRRMRFCVMVQ